MASLNFPTNPVNGQIYPSTPISGQKVYKWDSTHRTWILLGVATGVAEGTYGSGTAVPRITVDIIGNILDVQDVPLQLASTTQQGVVKLTNNTLSDDSTTALTAAQGYYLQTQIGNLALLAPPSVDLVTAINTAYDKTADLILLNPAINGNLTVQSALEDAVYDVTSSDLTISVAESAVGQVDITLPPVGAIGSYSYASITVDQEGRVTAASTNTAPNTTVVSPITNTGTNVEPVIGVLPSSTTQSGVVQLNNTLTSGATDQALTAAMGQNLQQQLSALSLSGGLTNAGTFDASTGQMTNVSVSGATAGFTVGADVPSPSAPLLDYFVQITVAGTYSPPGGGGPFDMVQGDWLFCNGTNWIQVEIGPRLPDATTTVKGAVELSTDAETQAGTDATLAVTPASLSSRSATETRTGLAEIATQAEVNAGADDTTIVTPLKLANYISGGGGGAPASGVIVSPAINGNANVQAVLEDAVYNVASLGGTITVTETATGQVNVDLPSTGVTPGSYDYASISVDSQGRITLASTNTLPVASTSTPGIVQLVDDTVTNDNTQALTASAGVSLQQQIDALAAVSNLTLAGTLDASTGLLLAVSTKGFAAGFVSGDPLPSASATNEEFFVIVTVPGDYAPPGGSSISTNDGDWFVSNGAQWVYYNVGPTPAYVQFDDVSAGFNGSQTVFNLSISGGNYAPVPSTNIMVFIGGVAQIPGAAYSVSGDQLTFTEPPETGASFYATTVRSS